MSGITLTSFALEMGAAEGTEGKTMFAWLSPMDYTLAATGENVKGTEAGVYEFDDDGLIVGLDHVFDTSKFPGVTSLAELAPPATSAARTAVLIATSFSMGAVAMAAFARFPQR